MPNHRTTPAALDFWRRGAVALAEVEAAGCRVDRGHVESSIVQMDCRIADLERQVVCDPNFKHWRRRYGDKAKPTSYDQLAAVVYRDLGFRARATTASGDRESAAKASLVEIDLPLVKNFIAAAELRKARDTYLVGILREMVQHADGDWYVHPTYNLNTVITFRSSASDPNFQNIPNRNPAIAECVRRCYIPRRGRQLGELDYGQIEVRIPVCYHDDPVLRRYVCDPSTDMHRDMACQLFKLAPNQVSKALRNLVKGAYVFATFYGSYWGLTARSLWEGVDSANIKLEGSDVTVREHLRAKGFTALGLSDDGPRDADPPPGSWAAWVREIDEDFWGKRFKVYSQWKRDWWDAYLRDGGFTMLTGFAVNAPLDKKQVCNAPVQGVAFHCLLWSLITQLEWLKKHKMRSLIIGEIHDAMNLDLDPRERDDVFGAAQEIMTNRIRRWAPWLNVPLVVEAETCPIDGPWFYKYALKETPSGFVPAAMDKWEKAHGLWALQTPED